MKYKFYLYKVKHNNNQKQLFLFKIRITQIYAKKLICIIKKRIYHKPICFT